MKEAIDELQGFAARSVRLYVEAITGLMSAAAGGADYQHAIERMANLLAATQGVASLLGRRRVWLEYDARKSTPPRRFDAGDQPIMPDVTFEEAVARLLGREPRLASGAEAVRTLYASGHFFGLAKATDLVIAKAVQREMASAIRDGTSTADAIDTVATMGDWTRSYAEVVFRTNVTSAYTDGRMEQAKDPEIADEFPGFQLMTVGDSDTRANHHAADGMLAATDDPIWNQLRPPLGYNCRCTIRLASIEEFRDRGMVVANGTIARARWPEGAHPDAGFRGGGR